MYEVAINIAKCDGANQVSTHTPKSYSLLNEYIMLPFLNISVELMIDEINMIPW